MRSTYIMHVIVWMLPVVAVQWALAWRAFRRNLRAVFLPPLLLGTFYTLADSVAVREGIWFFDRRQTLGFYVGPLPVEEIIFFYLTALLVSQTFVMLLPARLRNP